MALPGPCCFLQSLLSCPGPLHRCGEPGGPPPPPPLPPRAFLSSAVYTPQSRDCRGTRPELVIREGLGDAGGRARPIAGGEGVILRAWGGPGAAGAGAFCRSGLSITLPLPFPPFLSVFLPWSSSLPMPVIRPPGLASAAAPGTGKEPAQRPAQRPAARGRVLAPCLWGSRTPRPNEGCRWQKGKILQSLRTIRARRWQGLYRELITD